jgi:hypothetical protein
VRCALSEKAVLAELKLDPPIQSLDHLVDTDIASIFLAVNQRSTLFGATAHIVDAYPAHLKPYFLYLNGGSEIARLEMPSWVANNKELVDSLCSLVLDQIEKGRGYPIAIAEAHEAAVVKSHDREFFYQALYALSFKKNQYASYSQKSMRKRSMGI